MPISSSDINATFQRIHWEARIGGQLTTRILSGEVTSGVSQINSAASLILPSRPSGVQERQSLEIWHYINGNGAPLFVGEVVTANWETFPTRFRVEGRGLLARTRLEWGGDEREYTSADDAAIIQNLVEAMGIPAYLTHIESAGFTLGTVEPVVAPEGRAFWPLIEDIDKVTGYGTFDRIGAIFRQRISGSIGTGAVWSYTEGENIISCRRQRSADGIVNKAVVTGITYEDLTIGPATASAPNPFVPDPPGYVSEKFQSNLIEDEGTAQTVANRLVSDGNRRPESYEVEVILNPKVYPLSTIDLEHNEVETASARLVVDRVSHRFDGSAATARTVFTTLGGQVVATPTNMPPVAVFTTLLFQEAADDGMAVTSRIVIIADGTGSSDPDGDPAALTFAWAVSVDTGTVAPTTGSEPVYRGVISGAATTVTIELTVTDADAETAVATSTIPLVATALYVEDLTTAEDGLIAASNNGQLSWNEYTIPGGGDTCLAPFAPAWGQIWGAANGHIYATIDWLKTDAVDLGAPHGAVACTAVAVHEIDTTRAWIGFADGAVYQGTLVPATPSATWLARTTMPEGPVREIREGIGALGSLRATAGAGYYGSEDSGASWTLIHTFDTAWRMAAGFELNLASGLNDAAPLFEEGGSTPTVPGGVEHLRGITFGWRVQALYATDDAAALYLTDDTFAALTLHADSLPGAGNHMIRSGNEDGVIYIAVGDGTGTNGLVKWIPDVAAPFVVRDTGTRACLMAAYGAAHLPTAAVDFVFVPTDESGTDDRWWRYQDGLWTSGPLPMAGWWWFSIKVDPRNQLRWLLLGTSDGGSSGRTDDPLWLSENGGATWTAVDLPIPVTIDGDDENRTAYSWRSIGWSPETERWYLMAVEDSGAGVRGVWWTGTGTSDAAGHRAARTANASLANASFVELAWSTNGINGSYIVSERNSLPSGSSGGVGYIAGASTTTMIHTSMQDHTDTHFVPYGPIDSRPGTTYEAFIANRNTGGGLSLGIMRLPNSDAVAYNVDGSGTVSTIYPVLTGDYPWLGCGQDYLFVGSNVVGNEGMYAVAYAADMLDVGGPIEGAAPAHSMGEVIYVRVGRVQRRVCVSYGDFAGSAGLGFAGWDGAVWSDIPMPSVTIGNLHAGQDCPYDVIESAAPLI